MSLFTFLNRYHNSKYIPHYYIRYTLYVFWWVVGSNNNGDVLRPATGKLNWDTNIFCMFSKNTVKNGIRWVCVYKNVFNDNITTDNGLIHVIKFEPHNHETNSDVLETEWAIVKMKLDSR